MDLMIVKDVMPGNNDQKILTGPLLLKEFSLRSEVEGAFGDKVFVSSELGKRICVPVSGVSVSQAMGGNWQVSVAIDCSKEESNVVLDSIVSDNE
ncbi:MAG: hypothetical protein JAZ12_00960 [Candidatus Thiodiazotropha taylori]|nr:hypothetical protein [Candidatus Thiodiazotropha taylori]